MNTRTIRGVRAAKAMLALGMVGCLGACLGGCPKPVSTDTPKPTPPADARRPGTDVRRAAAQGRSYNIKFDRPLKVGLKYKVVATGRVDSSTTLNGKVMPAQTVNMAYSYEAVVTVMGVHACGKATKQEVKIVKLQVTKSGATKDMLPTGTIVLAEAKGTKKKFTVNGKLVAKDVAKVLGYVVSLFTGDATTTDDVFGPGGPKKPGDSWKPNAVKMLEGLKTKFKKAALWPKPSDVTGKVTFVAVKKVNGMDVLEIKVRTRLSNLAPNLGAIKATVGRMEITMSGWVPKDPKVIIDDYHSMTIKMHVEGEMVQRGKVIEFVVDYDQSMKKTTSPVK